MILSKKHLETSQLVNSFPGWHENRHLTDHLGSHALAAHFWKVPQPRRPALGAGTVLRTSTPAVVVIVLVGRIGTGIPGGVRVVIHILQVLRGSSCTLSLGEKLFARFPTQPHFEEAEDCLWYFFGCASRARTQCGVSVFCVSFG